MYPSACDYNIIVYKNTCILKLTHIAEILLKVTLNTITQFERWFLCMDETNDTNYKDVHVTK